MYTFSSFNFYNFYQLTSEKNQVHTGDLTHCKQTFTTNLILFDEKHEGH